MRLVLHIGTEKTATTTIQEFVYGNREQLRQHGISLSDVLDQPANRALAQYCLPVDQLDEYSRRLGISTAAENEQHFASLPDRLAREIELCSASTQVMFFSSEHLHSRLIDSDSIVKLRSLLQPLFSRIQIVCYFREQSALVKSLHSTSIKSGNTGDFATRLKSCTPANHYYNYHTFFSKWRQVFGSDCLTPRLFASSKFFQGDIRKDILRVIDSTIAFDTFDFASESKNSSHGPVGLALGRSNNLINPKFQADGSINQRRLAVAKIISNSSLATSGQLPLPEAAAIYDRFNDSNVQFANEFLGSKNNPFSRPEPAHTADGQAQGQQNNPGLQSYLQLFEDILQLFSDSSFNSEQAADTLRDIAIKIENQQPLGLDEARELMLLAKTIRPHGPLINNKLQDYESRLKNPKDSKQ